MNGWLRRLSEWLSRGVVLRRRLPKRFGSRPLLVTPDSRLAYWKRDLDRVEPNLLAWCEEFVSRGQTIWDIGANLGVFSLAAAVRTGPTGCVVALEPDLALARLLQRSAHLGSDREEAGITVLAFAAGETNELVQLQIANRGRSSNHLGKFGGGSQTGGTRESYQVMAVALDWLAERVPPPDLVKIDVEGAEAAVLAGAQGLLRESSPIVLVEVYQRNQERVAKILGDIGYNFYNAAVRAPADRQPLPGPVGETLCLPEEIQSWICREGKPEA